MRDALENYLRQGHAEGWTEGTVRTYRMQLEELLTFLEALGLSAPSEVTRDDLDAFLKHLSKKGLAFSVRQGRTKTALRFFRELFRTGKIPKNPTRGLHAQGDDEAALPAPPLSVEEVDAFLNGLPKRHAIDLRNRALTELLYGCGLRLNEALDLNLKDIDLSTRTVFVRMGKGGHQRTLPMGRGAVNALRDYLALRRSLLKGPDHGAFFLDRRGRRLRDTAVRTWFEDTSAVRARIGAPHVHAHLLRHSIAVHLLQGGADIRAVQELLGHANLDTTKIYLRMVPGRLKEDYEKAMPEIAVASS